MAGSVRQTRSGRWELRIYTGRDTLTGKKRWASKTVEATGKRDAQAQADRWAVELGATGPTTAGTFGELVDQWIDVKARTWSPSTLREHRRIADRNLTPLRPVALHRLTTHTLDRYYAELAARGGACKAKAACGSYPCGHGGPLSPATVRRVHVVVRAALAQGVKWGWLARNPASHAEPGTVDEDEVDPPSAADVVRLLAKAADTDPRLATFLLVSIVTGARRGAVCALRWTDLDLPAGTARFPRVVAIGPDGPVERPATKSKRSGRKVALDAWAVAALVAHHDRQFTAALEAGAAIPADALVFSDDILGRRPWRPDSTSRKFRQLRDTVGLDGVRLHDLRHFMATALLAAGVDPKVIAQRGGWTKVATMLDRYAHALPAADRAAADVIGGMVAGN